MGRRLLFWSLFSISTIYPLDAVDSSGISAISISSVPTYVKTENEEHFPVDITELRLFMANSYIKTAHQALKLTDNTKSIACFAAAYGWLSAFKNDHPPPEMIGAVTFKLIELLSMLSWIARPYDQQAVCCAGVEATFWARGFPVLEDYVRKTFESTKLWDICPAHFLKLTKSIYHYAGTKEQSNLGCDRLGLLNNAEDIIGNFYKRQDELFTKRHPYQAYQEIFPKNIYEFTSHENNNFLISQKQEELNVDDNIKDDDDDDDRCLCDKTMIVHDLDLTPLTRFTPKQWHYKDDEYVEVENYAAAMINEKFQIEENQKNNGEKVRNMKEWPQSGHDSYKLLKQVGLDLGFNEMFHSCIPEQNAMDYPPPPPPQQNNLICVWRRHMNFFHMGAQIFHASIPWSPPNHSAPATMVLPSIHQSSVIQKVGASLIGPGEDPRIFKFRGKFYFSMQKVTNKLGKQWNKQTMEQEFRNFLIELDSGLEVELSIPNEYGEDGKVPNDHNGVSFAPHGKNWTPLVYEDELLFIFTFRPLRILQCDIADGQCVWWHQPPPGASTEVGVLRGGSATQVINNYAIGFGHATLSSAQHSPFFFALNLRCVGPNRHQSCRDNVDEGRSPLNLAFMPSQSFATPFSGFSYMDPTSFWLIDDDNDVDDNDDGGMIDQEEEDSFLFKKRMFVMCTLRAAPDYLSFDQSHHQTIIFEANTQLFQKLILRQKTKQTQNAHQLYPNSNINKFQKTLVPLNDIEGQEHKTLDLDRISLSEASDLDEGIWV